MAKNIAYKGIKYQDLNDESQLKLKVEKYIPNNDVRLRKFKKR